MKRHNGIGVSFGAVQESKISQELYTGLKALDLRQLSSLSPPYVLMKNSKEKKR